MGLNDHQEAPANGFLCGIESDTKGMYMSGVCLISLPDKGSMEAAMAYAENQAQYETKGLSAKEAGKHGGLPVAAVLILPVLILNFDF
jgi:hypothetical protein